MHDCCQRGGKLFAMKNNFYERCEYLIAHWWLSLIVGLVAVVVGFIVVLNPAESYYSIAIWFGVVVLLSGAFGIVQASSSNNYLVRRGWFVIASVIDIIIGMLLLFNVLLSAAILPILLGIWLLYRGLILVMQGVDIRGYGVGDAGWVIFGGVLIIAISIAILLLPETLGVEAVVLSVAIACVVYGVTAISLAFRLYEVHRRARALQ